MNTHKFDQLLFTTVTAQLKSGAVTVKTGTLVEDIAITSANINDGRAGPDVLPDDPGEVFARVDGGRRPPRLMGQSLPTRRSCKRRNTAHCCHWHLGRDEQETLRKLKEWNQPIHRVRNLKS